MRETHSTQFRRRPALTRRLFVENAAAAVGGCFLLGAGPKTIGRASNVIFILLAGGPSHVDTFDLKEGPWLNEVVGGRKVSHILRPTSYGDIRFPQGLMPTLATQLDRIALLRSVRSWTLVHELAQGWIQIGCDPFSAAGRTAPHIGCVVARELGAAKTPVPAFISDAGAHSFRLTDDEKNRYGGTSDGKGSDFGNSCLAARNLLRSRLGARFIQLRLDGWDHHCGIYQPNAGLQAVARQLDKGLGNLIIDLRREGLLDETLIVSMGEFGRTAGALNAEGGRDHFPQQTVLMAGARIPGNRAIGSTDPTGAEITESGWSRNREIRAEDIQATIYAALGIDWNAARGDDPARQFEYGPVNELWG